MPPARADHWNAVHDSRGEEELTWFEADPDLSADLVARHAAPGDAIIDVGGGATRLVDALLARGLGPVTVLDISESALRTSRERLGARAADVTWIVADVTRAAPPGRFVVWHDRAVFHFLTEEPDRAAYVRALAGGLAPGGWAIVATFAEDGPEMCSGLPVRRYAPDDLTGEFERHAPGLLEPVASRRHVHVTPKGAEQRFQYSVFRRIG